jgi:hypothetical protein
MFRVGDRVYSKIYGSGVVVEYKYTVMSFPVVVVFKNNPSWRITFSYKGYLNHMKRSVNRIFKTKMIKTRYNQLKVKNEII